MDYISQNHSKYLLMAHLIFSCKYCKKLLIRYGNEIKQILYEIAEEKDFVDDVGIFKIKHFRKKKRSLHEATARKGRKEPNREAKRNKKNTKYSNGFYLNDKVKIFGQIGWISGFNNGGCYVKGIEDNYITIPDKSYKQVGFKNLEFIHHNNNWQWAIHPTT